MADYYGMGRTNYVLLRDRARLDADLKRYGIDGLQIFEKGGRVSFCGYNFSDSGGLPTWAEDEETGEEIEVFPLLAQHIADGEIIVFMEAGSEKARYCTGFALAMNNKCEQVSVRLEDIYTMAAKHFDVEEATITEASY